MKDYRNSLKFCYWNVGAVYRSDLNKLEDNEFLREIREHDLVILGETHIGYNTPDNITDYDYFPVCRNISSNGRYFGGLAILRNKSVKNHIKILQNTCKDYQWILLEKDFFNLP